MGPKSYLPAFFADSEISFHTFIFRRGILKMIEDSEMRIRTLELLNERKHDQTIKVIAKATNLGERWIRLFIKQKINEPSVVKCERLYKYLAKVDSLNLS